MGQLEGSNAQGKDEGQTVMRKQGVIAVEGLVQPKNITLVGA